jgi:hypothetical protein
VVKDVAREFVLQPQLFFLEAVEKVLVGGVAILFLGDEGVNRCMLGLQVLD